LKIANTTTLFAICIPFLQRQQQHHCQDAIAEPREAIGH
jgi:hypothetical protein